MQAIPAASGPAAAQGAYGQQALLGSEDLDRLVGPIALYPDALLAQVFVAATYPDQILQAKQWLDGNRDLSDQNRAAQADEQPWADSVKALAAGFPSVVDRMANDFGWTRQLGDAVLAQNDDVLEAVQRDRRQARQVGNLTSNQAQVVEDDNGQIRIKPASPDVIYVPSYDADTAYRQSFTQGPLYQTPDPANAQTSGFSTGSLLTAGAIAFGAGLLVDKVFNDNNDNDHDHDKSKAKASKAYWTEDNDQIDWHGRRLYVEPATDAPGASGNRRPAWTPPPDRVKQARSDLADSKNRAAAGPAPARKPAAAAKPAAANPQGKPAAKNAPAPSQKQAAPAPAPVKGARPPAQKQVATPAPTPDATVPDDSSTAKATAGGGATGQKAAAKPAAQGHPKASPGNAAPAAAKATAPAAVPSPAKVRAKPTSAGGSPQPKAAAKCSTKEAKSTKACKSGG